jgi:ankyrin repeat protein
MPHPKKITDFAQEGEWDEVETALITGENVNTKDEVTGKTSLHYAAEEGNFDAVEMLLGWDADCAATDHMGLTPAELASTSGQREMALFFQSR